MRRNTVVAGEQRHFANQIFFNFEIESEARRRDNKPVAVSPKIKADSIECIGDRVAIDRHAEHPLAALDAHGDRLALRDRKRLIINGSRLPTANFDDQARDVFDVLGVGRVVDTSLETVRSVGRKVVTA